MRISADLSWPDFMRRHGLKYLRTTAGLLVLIGLFAAFVDFREMMPASVARHLAEIQFIPSWIALLTGASMATAGIVIVVVTLLAGRLYCSVICPLGLFQDAIARISGWLRKKPKLLPYCRPSSRVRQVFLWGSVVGMLVGWVGFTLSLVDPYSIFGRIVSGLFRPAVTVANNGIVSAVRVFGIDAIYRVEPQWAGVGALALPAAMLVTVVALVLWRGRLYCNTVCPVGTLLGLLSSRSAFRLDIDRDACRKCGACLRVCKSQCIDLRSGVIDSARCVACFDCVSVCNERGIHYHFAWKNQEQAPRKPVIDVPDQQRRKFLASTTSGLTVATGFGVWLWAGKAEAQQSERLGLTISPPGSVSLDRFLNQCTACQLCVTVCPTHVLQPAFLEYGLRGLMKPHMDYRHSFCNFTCNQCGEVCPDGAISILTLANKQITRIGTARLELEKCVVKTKGTDCAACSEHCPTKAVETIPYGNNLRLPQVKEELCIGCGACEYACPAQPLKAITVVGLRRHEVSEKRIEGKAEKPKANGDFPF
jgi:ferredoxin